MGNAGSPLPPAAQYTLLSRNPRKELRLRRQGLPLSGTGGWGPARAPSAPPAANRFLPPPPSHGIEGSDAVLQGPPDHLENPVSDVVPVRVVDVLEAIDVREKDAERPAVPFHLLEPRSQLHLHLPPVAQLRHRVEQRHRPKFRDQARGRILRRIVAEHLDRPGDSPARVHDRRDAYRYRDTVAVLVEQVQIGLARSPVPDRLRDHARPIARALPPPLHVPPAAVAPAQAQHLMLFVPGDPFGSLAPVRNLPVPVHEIDPFEQDVEEVPGKVCVHPLPSLWIHRAAVSFRVGGRAPYPRPLP